MSDDKAAARSHRRLLSHPLWRRAFADRLYLALVVCLVVAQGATSAVDWYGFTYQGWREANPTWAVVLSASPLLSASVRFLVPVQDG
jgi:hypothetical protein